MNMTHINTPNHESGSIHPPVLARHWHWRFLAASAAATLAPGTIPFDETPTSHYLCVYPV